MSVALADDTRNIVRDHYAKVSTGNAGCAPGCCEIALDARGKPTDFSPRAQPACKSCG